LSEEQNPGRKSPQKISALSRSRGPAEPLDPIAPHESTGPYARHRLGDNKSRDKVVVRLLPVRVAPDSSPIEKTTIIAGEFRGLPHSLQANIAIIHQFRQ